MVGAGDATGDRLAQGLGLFVDLLEHEVLEAALLGGLGRPVDGRDDPLDLGAVDVGDRHAPWPQVGDVAVLEEHHLVRVGQDGRHVAREEALAIGQPDHEGHVLAGPDKPVGLAAVHHGDGVGALGLAQGGPDRVGEVAGVGLLDHVCEGFGVGLGGELVASRHQPVAQLPEVLDDPVVDDRDLAGAVLVWVGVEVVRPAVRGPASVGEADRRMRRPIRDRGLEIGQLPGPFLDEQVPTVIDQRDPSRVVAPILQAPQPLDEDRAGLPGPRVSNDAAHTRLISRSAAIVPATIRSEVQGGAPRRHWPEDSPLARDLV